VSDLEIIAHRGYSAAAPENTLAAMDAAVAAGADAVEFDIQVGLGGVPVLLHDGTLDRTTDASGPVERHALDQLKELDAGRWFGPAFAGERIPTLAEAFAHLGTRVTRIYAEVKGYGEPEHIDGMVRVAEEAGALERTVFIAIEWHVLERVRALRPSAAIGYIVTRPDQVDDAVGRTRGDAQAMLDVDARIVLADPSVARRARDAGLDTAVWTVDDVADAERLRGLGIRRITTNQVERLLAWKRTR
jgi:glycerophosphoryl diester phosphodiesterase